MALRWSQIVTGSIPTPRQFLFRFAQVLVGFQIEQYANRFAFGIGHELFIFQNQSFHGCNVSSAFGPDNSLSIPAPRQFLLGIHNFLNLRQEPAIDFRQVENLFDNEAARRAQGRSFNSFTTTISSTSWYFTVIYSDAAAPLSLHERCIKSSSRRGRGGGGRRDVVFCLRAVKALTARDKTDSKSE
jgi:hypothetical protein